MIHAIKTDEEPESKLVVHRNFDGEHELTETCWCRPETVEAESSEESQEIAARLDRADG